MSEVLLADPKNREAVEEKKSAQKLLEQAQALVRTRREEERVARGDIEPADIIRGIGMRYVFFLFSSSEHEENKSVYL